jgi:uncharacterized protein YjbI with pentapeptide repeats
MKRTDLSYRDLRHTEFSDLHYLNLKSSNLEGRSFSKFRDIHACRANLTRANFTGADITDTIFDQCDLNCANLTKVKGSLVCFKFVRLRRANLKQACLKESTFVRSDLTEVDLEEAVLEDCDLSFVSLEDAILTNTYLPGTSLGNSNLRGVLRAVDLSSVRADCTDLGGDDNSVLWDYSTVWPKDMTGFVNIPTALQTHLGL